jgi:hypothetical protein
MLVVRQFGRRCVESAKCRACYSRTSLLLLEKMRHVSDAKSRQELSYPKYFVLNFIRSLSMGIVANMSGLTLPPGQKRILADSTNTAHNSVKSPPSAKKRKLNGNLPNGQFTSSPAGQGSFRSKMGSSQPKSHFETEVLEKMTQDISDLKRSNTERDQQFERPSLDDFNAKRDSLCFQQIEIEEGTLHGGQVTLKLFGVSEVPICLGRWKRR